MSCLVLCPVLNGSPATPANITYHTPEPAAESPKFGIDEGQLYSTDVDDPHLPSPSWTWGIDEATTQQALPRPLFSYPSVSYPVPVPAWLQNLEWIGQPGT